MIPQHTPTSEPTPRQDTDLRKPKSLKIDGSLIIRLQTVAHDAGLDPTRLAEAGVEAACVKAERRSRGDLLDYLGLDNGSES